MSPNLDHLVHSLSHDSTSDAESGKWATAAALAALVGSSLVAVPVLGSVVPTLGAAVAAVFLARKLKKDATVKAIKRALDELDENQKTVFVSKLIDTDKKELDSHLIEKLAEDIRSAQAAKQI
jgi:primosomal protein N'